MENSDLIQWQLTHRRPRTYRHSFSRPIKRNFACAQGFGLSKARKRDLERSLNQADPTPKLKIHPNLGELYRRKVSDLETLLQDEDTKPQSTDILRSLIQRIDISAGQRRGHAEVRIFGALASILDFALESTHAKATANGGLCRVLMVALAGFEPAAFRL